MSIGRTATVLLRGLEGVIVQVEADVSPGLPAFHMVGLPDSSTLQARERVRSATQHAGVPLPARRITVNMTPAWLPKHGSGHDLAIAVAVLAAHEALGVESAAESVHYAEVGLDGTLHPVPGVLPAVLAAAQAGYKRVVVAAEAQREASLVPGVEVVGAATLAEVIAFHRGEPAATKPIGSGQADAEQDAPETQAAGDAPDFADVLGQAEALQAALVAAAGGHNLFLLGPPGAGKSMIAKRLPGILPPLTDEEAVQVSAIASLSGAFDASGGLLRTPPMVSPHHSASMAALVGGGSGMAAPGAISCAHCGLLFLDEAPEFSPRVLDSLRQPLEDGHITLHRARHTVSYPARFQLVLAANPCPCGLNVGARNECSCSPREKTRYFQRISGPVMDRIDVYCRVRAVDLRTAAPAGTSTAEMARRVADARERQAQRYKNHPFKLNSQVPGPLLRGEFAPAKEEAKELMDALMNGRISMRGYDRTARLAWTVADLEGAERPTREHIGTALFLRGRA
ncbi:YifB family Mg chelatase-like AAA ATPase [Dermabacteraceae bacterium P13115]